MSLDPGAWSGKRKAGQPLLLSWAHVLLSGQQRSARSVQLAACGFSL